MKTSQGGGKRHLCGWTSTTVTNPKLCQNKMSNEDQATQTQLLDSVLFPLFLSPINLVPIAYTSYRFLNLVQFSRHSEWILLDLNQCIPDGDETMLQWFFSIQPATVAHTCYASTHGRLEAVAHIASMGTGTLLILDNLSEIAQCAATSGSIPILDYLQLSPEDTSQLYTAAAKGGHVPVLQWIHERTPVPLYTSIVINAALGSHLEALEWMRRRGFNFDDPRARAGAGATNDPRVIECLHRFGCSMRGMWEKAIIFGRTEILRTLHRLGFSNKDSMYLALRSGRLDSIIICEEMGETLDRNAHAIVIGGGCADKEKIEILEWLKMKGLPHNDLAVNAAIDANSFETLHWLLKTESKPSASHGYTDTLDWIFHLHDDMSHLIYLKSAQTCDLSVFEWLDAHGYAWTSIESLHAVALGRLDAVKWLFERGVMIGPIDSVTYISVAEGHLDILEWLKNRGFTLDMRVICSVARQKRKPNVLRWAREDVESTDFTW
ncbi:Ankyrin repeat protein [Planoprotostelium fungivorum]|uniref:Ankyrin repeat protein n=1 Tax=Planoprotostelium fungivorum TaxID=1890364 RepID=A0A2P6N983_9EUKA|nr:Ankyrin repeat protein [Planoprotostelium fungivorum]